jgi:calcineurin-like phosphoesterase family protein
LSYPELVIGFSHEPDTEDLYWDVNVHGHTHGNTAGHTPLPGTQYVNVSVEKTGYAPIRLRDALENALERRAHDSSTRTQH